MKRDRSTTYVERGSLETRQLWIAVLLALLAIGCASVPDQSPEMNAMRIFTRLPADLAVETIDEVTVSHGSGCGLFGATGSREGAEALLRQVAVSRGADGALISAWSGPHLEGGCRVNSYRLRATLLRLPVLEYTPPAGRQGGYREFQFVMPAGYDETWSSLIDAVASSFFEVSNYEKDSGLLTLGFEPDTPSEYVDCGEWKKSYLSGQVSFSGPYVDWLQMGTGFGLTMRINLRLKPVGADRTEVEITSLYDIDAPSHDLDFKFKTNSTSKKKLGDLANKAPGTIDYRLCQATHKLEQDLLAEIDPSSPGN